MAVTAEGRVWFKTFLRNYLNRHELTQSQLARRWHISQRTVSRWENDDGESTLVSLERIAEIAIGVGLTPVETLGLLSGQVTSERALRFYLSGLDKNQLRKILGQMNRAINLPRRKERMPKWGETISFDDFYNNVDTLPSDLLTQARADAIYFLNGFLDL